MGSSRFALLASVFVLVACGPTRASDDPAVPRTGSAAQRPTPPAPETPLPPPLPGIDLGALANDEKHAFYEIVGAVNSPCGEPVSIERCIRQNTACTSCAHAAKYAVRLLAQGYPGDAVRDLMRIRYAADTAVTLSSEGCSWKGGSMARVSIIEFADFECPHCKEAHHGLDTLLADAEIGPSMRVCYRFFPLAMHENARAAAIAAVAAMNQGKFWPMHDLLYEHQDALSPAAYLEFANQIGLDRARFQADIAQPATEARVQRDRTEGESVQIEGTPAIFVNGRRYEEIGPLTVSLRDYILEELQR